MPEWTGSRFLDQFIDGGLDADASWTPDGERSRQLDRLVPACAVTLLVANWPGRLDEKHYTRAQRSMDKKLAKRVTSRLLTAINQWGGSEAMVIEYQEAHADTVRQQAAILEWRQWWADHKIHITNCLRHVATNAAKNAYVKDGNRFCNALSNEYRSLDDVLGTFEQL